MTPQVLQHRQSATHQAHPGHTCLMTHGTSCFPGHGLWMTLMQSSVRCPRSGGPHVLPTCMLASLPAGLHAADALQLCAVLHSSVCFDQCHCAATRVQHILRCHHIHITSLCLNVLLRDCTGTPSCLSTMPGLMWCWVCYPLRENCSSLAARCDGIFRLLHVYLRGWQVVSRLLP